MKQILVVGSDPRISQDLDKYLDPNEFKLLACPHGKSAIASLANAKPDLVILDFASVDQPGLEIINKIRESDAALALIVLSNDPAYSEMKAADKNFRVLPAPFRVERIANMVRDSLASRSPKREQKVLQGSVRLAREKDRLGVRNDPNRPVQDQRSGNQDYHQIFDRTLGPIFDQIIRDCRGHVYDRLLSGLEKTMLSEVLKYVNHNQVRASQLLGISRNTLRERMKRYDIF
ncbi:MAG: response regulator [Candidatus Zixiibacteriota bacterium]|nr:MAG: response regulator [candidate division Zixibacteria bacterium]